MAALRKKYFEWAVARTLYDRNQQVRRVDAD